MQWTEHCCNFKAHNHPFACTMHLCWNRLHYPEEGIQPRVLANQTNAKKHSGLHCIKCRGESNDSVTNSSSGPMFLKIWAELGRIFSKNRAKYRAKLKHPGYKSETSSTVATAVECMVLQSPHCHVTPLHGLGKNCWLDFFLFGFPDLFQIQYLKL